MDKDLSYGQQAFALVSEICKEFGPRPSSSEAERKGSQYLKDKLKDLADEIKYDEFEVHPGLYPRGLIILASYCVYIAFVTHFLVFPYNLLSIFLPLFGLFIIFVSLILMKEWFAFFFKKGKSQNILGVIKPKAANAPSPPKKRIIIAGHTDSAAEMKITELGDNIAKITAIAILYLFVILISTIIKAILTTRTNAIAVLLSFGPFAITWLDVIFFGISIIGIPVFTYVIQGYTASSNYVLGANDNLIGAGIAYALGKYFTEEQKLKNIELWVGSFGSEEVGERGSHAFVKKYGKSGDLNNAITIVPESCGAGSELAIITYERMHLAHHNLPLCNEVFDAYKKYSKEKAPQDVVPCSVKALPFAASDAGRFSLAGFPATMILGYDGAIMKPANWHSKEDKPENLNIKMITTVFGIIKTYISDLDEKLNSE